MSFQEPLTADQVQQRQTEYIMELESHIEALKRQQATAGESSVEREQRLMLQIQLREKELQQQLESRDAEYRDQIDRLQEQLMAATDRAAQTRESVVRMRDRLRAVKEKLRVKEAELDQMRAERQEEQVFQEGVALGQTKALETVLTRLAGSVVEGAVAGAKNRLAGDEWCFEPAVETPVARTMMVGTYETE